MFMTTVMLAVQMKHGRNVDGRFLILFSTLYFTFQGIEHETLCSLFYLGLVVQ